MSEKVWGFSELDLFLSLRNLQRPLRKKVTHMKEQFQSWSPKNDGSSRQHEVGQEGKEKPTPSTRGGQRMEGSSS